MLNPCEEEEVFFDTEDHLTGKEEITGSLGHDIWLSEPQSISVRRKMFLSKMRLLDHFETHEVESSRLTESTEAESIYSESSNVSIYDCLLYERMQSNSEANCSVGYSYQESLNDMNITDMEMEADEDVEKKSETKPNRRKQNNVVNLWKQISQRLKKRRVVNSMKETTSSGAITCMKVEQNRKRYKELTCLYSGQELKAHNGLIRAIKFSPNGKYLASGGEDGVVCVWRIRSKDASCDTNGCIFANRDEKEVSAPPSKMKYYYNHASIVVPDKIFHIDEEPIHKFHGHSSDVLDLSWSSSSNYLLSSSTDNAVRLWKVGSDRCLRAFQHVSYVTCVQFNPVDENYFISGSIDGKVRVWGVRTGRVEDWANVRDIVTALCYQPNGKGFLVGSVSGICRFYYFSGEDVVLNAEVKVYRRRKSSGNRITSIRFLARDSQRVMITSDDSKICILEGFEVVSKYKGLAKSGIQMPASFSSNGKHIVSVGGDSRVYLYNHYDSHIQSSDKRAKTISSFERFLSKGVTVALPWSESASKTTRTALDSERFFSLAKWLSYSMESSSRSCRGSWTWPEEKLPSPVYTKRR